MPRQLRTRSLRSILRPVDTTERPRVSRSGPWGLSVFAKLLPRPARELQPRTIERGPK